MSDQALRSNLIRLADELPRGDKTRKALLDVLTERSASAKQGAGYSGDPNVSLESVTYDVQKLFLEDVVRAIIRYSGLKTPVKGKPGGTFMRGSRAHGNLVNRTGEEEFSLGIEAQVSSGKILVKLSDIDGQNVQKFKFPAYDTPASIGSDLSDRGRAYLMGETP